MQVYCAKCENACSEEDSFCPKCGHPLQKPGFELEESHKERLREMAFDGRALKSRVYLLGVSIRRGRIGWRPGLLFACVVGGCLGFGIAEHQEIEARKRIDEIMKIQSRAADERVRKQLEQQEALERIADRRRQGGFAGRPEGGGFLSPADVARRVLAGAEKARRVFRQLTEQEVNLAFGTFGDVEGLSQRDLEDLAIVAYLGGFEELDRVKGLSPKGQADWLLKHYRERIELFAWRETIQG